MKIMILSSKDKKYVFVVRDDIEDNNVKFCQKIYPIYDIIIVVKI